MLNLKFELNSAGHKVSKSRVAELALLNDFPQDIPIIKYC